MAWRIEISAGALKQLKNMGHVEARRIWNYLRQRVEPLDDPRALGVPLKGSLGGLWRYRAGDYRVICELQDAALVVLVLRVGRRRAVYR